jgi:Kef-type K+ transport system membrane component KefB
VFAGLFPQDSLPHLNTLSQVGLLLFMFLVGLEFEPRLMRGRGHAAVVTSHVSIIYRSSSARRSLCIFTRAFPTAASASRVSRCSWAPP